MDREASDLSVRLIILIVDYPLASCRVSSLVLAIVSHALALAAEASKSLAKRRLRLSQARVRSTTQRRGKGSKPVQPSERLMISSVQWPSAAKAVASLSPA